MSITKPGTFTQAGTRGKSKRGRTPSIDMDKIAHAVRKVSLDETDISMKDVADHLG